MQDTGGGGKVKGSKISMPETIPDHIAMVRELIKDPGRNALICFLCELMIV